MSATGFIWKFPLDVGLNYVAMPPDAKILHADAQGGQVTIWAACNPALQATARRAVRVVLTGDRVPDDAEYVGTVLLHGGACVVHVYDEGEMMDA